MDFLNLKQSVESIELSDTARERIMNNCRMNLEECNMKTNKKLYLSKRPLTVAAVLALCICLSATGVAMQNSGFFKDVTNWKQAVVGTVYEQATNEISVTVNAEENALTVTAMMLEPDTVPYRELQDFAIEHYEIVDASGAVVATGTDTDYVKLVDGKATINILLDNLERGHYQLLIHSFLGYKKAEQPLPIKGSWECEFSI